MNQITHSTTKPFKREYGMVTVVLAAAILLFWWRVWIPSPVDRMHFTDDILIKDYPTRIGLFRQVLEGHWPLWDPYQLGGWPGLANCEAGLFYPPNWILIPFSNTPEWAFQITQWLVLLHFFIAGMGAYCFSRYIGLSPLSAGFVMIAYTFCGFHCAHKKHTNMLFALVWFPWLLWIAEQWIRNKHGKFLWRLTLLLSLVYLAGHPQASLYLTLLLFARLVYGLFESSQTGSVQWKTIPYKDIALIVGTIILASALAAIQLWPTWELIREGERAGANVFQSSAEFSLPPLELLEAFLPEALRHITQVEVFYWGLIPFLLAIHSLLRGHLTPVSRYLIAVFIGAVLLSLGEFVFAYDISYILVPGAAWVRAPSRWIYFASFPLAVIAGRELEYLLSGRHSLQSRNSSLFWKIVWAIALIVSVSLILILMTLNQTTSAEMRNQISQDLIRSFLFMILLGGTFLILYHQTLRQNIRPSLFIIVVIFMCWIDLGTQFRTFDLEKGDGGYSLDTEVQLLQQASWNHRTKIQFENGLNRTLYHGAAQDFMEVDGQSPLSPRLQNELRHDTFIQFPDKINHALFRMLGIGAILTDLQGLPPQWKRKTQRLYWTDVPQYHAWALRDVFPVDVQTQRNLLTLQSFPFDQVALVHLGYQLGQPAVPSPGSLFPKPFLLASCSAKAVHANAFLIIDGKDQFADFIDQKSGYCIAVADPRTGKIEKKEQFDLMAGLDNENRTTHKRMLEFIQEVPQGHIVFAAVKDNASNSLLPIGLAALQEIGASLDVRGGYQMAHAIVGRKGAPIGSALELFSATETLVLQTKSSLYIQGKKAQPPTPEFVVTSNFAPEWNKLLTTLSKFTRTKLTYVASDKISDATDPLRPMVPVSVFSAPKKETSIPTEDRASILVAGQEYALNQKGYNLVVADPETFHVVASESFDLFKDFNHAIGAFGDIDPASPENGRMRSFIQSVTPGYVVLGAIRDDGTDLMTQETRETFSHCFGSTWILSSTTPETRKRNGHAFIAVKGASRCLEIGGKEKDVILFTRYPGGPALSHTEANIKVGTFIPANPLDEIRASNSATMIPRAKTKENRLPWAVTTISPTQLRITGQSDSDEIIFLSEIFYPGWKAFVDGVMQPILRMNYYFRGIQVPPGRHVIEMIYAPVSFRMGATVSIIAFLIFMGWGIGLRLQKPTRS